MFNVCSKKLNCLKNKFVIIRMCLKQTCSIIAHGVVSALFHELVYVPNLCSIQFDTVT